MGEGNEVDQCIVMPVLPDQFDRMDYFWESLNTNKANEVVQYFEIMGYNRFIATLQALPQGRFIVEFIRGKTDIRLSFPRNRKIDLPIADYLRSEISAYCGYDYTMPDNIPDIRPLWEWSDSKASLSWKSICSVFMMPVLPGKTQEAIRLYDELRGPKSEEIGKDLQRHKIAKLEAFLQTGREGHFPQGTFITHCIQSANPLDRALYGLATGGSDMANHYREKIAEISGMDWSKKGDLPRINKLFDWSAKKGLKTSIQQATTTL